MDQFTEVSEQGLGGNLLDSLKGVVVGVLLFLVSFPVLWWNEGRPDLSKWARKALTVDSAAVTPTGDGKLVAVTGTLKALEKLSDPQFLRPGDYLAIERHVEMYAWTEEQQSRTEKKLGGGSRTETTYTYSLAWTEHPRSSSSFKERAGHENPDLPVSSQTFKAQRGAVGAYTFQPSQAELPSGTPLSLSADLLKGAGTGDEAPAVEQPDQARPALGAPDAPDGEEAPAPRGKHKHHGRRHHGGRVERSLAAPQAEPADTAHPATAPGGPAGYGIAGDKYLFRGRGSLDSPKLGDVRVHFDVLLPGGLVTLFGQKQGGSVGQYRDGDVDFYRVLRGDRDAATQTLATEHKVITWLLRGLGFFLMWLGLMLFFGPINAVLDIVPFLGSAGRFLIGLATLPFAMVVSTVVILLSIIAHSPILLVLTVLAIGAGGYYLYQKRRRQKALA